jgi:hypothetical protein
MGTTLGRRLFETIGSLQTKVSPLDVKASAALPSVVRASESERCWHRKGGEHARAHTHKTSSRSLNPTPTSGTIQRGRNTTAQRCITSRLSESYRCSSCQFIRRLTLHSPVHGVAEGGCQQWPVCRRGQARRHAKIISG